MVFLAFLNLQPISAQLDHLESANTNPSNQAIMLPSETRLQRKSLKYLGRGCGDESSSSATPYFTDSDRDLVVETETMILRHHNRPHILDGRGTSQEGVLIAIDDDQEEFLYHSSTSPKSKQFMKKHPSTQLYGRLNRFPLQKQALPFMAESHEKSLGTRSLRLKRSASQLHLQRPGMPKSNQFYHGRSKLSPSRSDNTILDVDETSNLLSRSPSFHELEDAALLKQKR